MLTEQRSLLQQEQVTDYSLVPPREVGPKQVGQVQLLPPVVRDLLLGKLQGVVYVGQELVAGDGGGLGEGNELKFDA